MTEVPRLLQVTQNVSPDVFQMVLEKSMTWWLVALSSELVPYHKTYSQCTGGLSNVTRLREEVRPYRLQAELTPVQRAGRSET